MTGKIVLHLGPPKTATTSLQHAFEKLQLDGVIYGGTFQPRERNTGSLSQRLHKHVRDTGREAKTSHTDLQCEIRGLVEAGNTVLLSEEMFLVAQEDASIPAKLVNLRRALADTPCSVVLTLRDPRDALPSYYQELFDTLPLELQLSFPKFCRDARCKCFDYSWLVGQLDSIGFPHTTFIDFADIESGRVGLHQILGDLVTEGEVLEIATFNASKMVGDTTQRRLPRITVKSLARSAPLKYVINGLRLRNTRIFAWLRKKADQIPLRKNARVALRMPPDVAAHFAGAFAEMKKKMKDDRIAKPER